MDAPVGVSNHLSMVDSTPGTWRESRYSIQDSSSNFVDNISGSPQLDQLRELSRKHGDPFSRIDILNAGLSCSSCGESISERFSSDEVGNLLCWDCAMGRVENVDNRDVRVTTDPTKTVLSQSSLHHKNLCNYVINVATGCTHGCKFCYVPSTPNIKARGEMLNDQVGVEDGQREWGSYLLYRDDLPERLGRKLDRKQTWNNEDGGRGVVMISSGTDCYQDRRAAQITRGCVIELVRHGRPVRILTRSPAVVRDIDVFEAADGLVTVGSSIPCLDDEMVRAIEPGAPAPSTRLNALEQISEQGIPVYVSMSPTYPTQDREDLRALLKEFKRRLDPDVVFHEPINPRGGNFDMTIQAAEESGQQELAEELAELKTRENWIEYSKRQLRHVEELGEELDVPVHLWPDKQFVKYTDEMQDHFRHHREKENSPENYPLAPISG